MRFYMSPVFNHPELFLFRIIPTTGWDDSQPRVSHSDVLPGMPSDCSSHLEKVLKSRTSVGLPEPRTGLQWWPVLLFCP